MCIPAGSPSTRSPCRSPPAPARSRSRFPWERAGPAGLHAATLAFFVETLAASALLAVLIYGFYRYSARLADLIGPTGTTIVVRLSAFLLFCIGIQVLWNGAAELLQTLQFHSAS